MTRVHRIVSAVVAIICLVPNAGAHTRSESYSHWHLSDTTVAATITIPLREVMLLYQDGDSAIPPADLFRNELVAKTTVSSASGNCSTDAVNILQAASGFVRVEMIFDCGEAAPAAIRYRALFDAAPAHVHYAKLHRDGGLRSETLITDTSDAWNIADIGNNASHSFSSFLAIGIEHIAGGIDHVAFLIGMLLIAGSIGRAIIAVTGFTLGHSVSLGAAVLGYVHADGTLVEAFIGFTVALVAVEYYLLRKPAQHSTMTLAVSSMAIAWAVGLLALTFDLISGRALFVYLGFGIFAFCYLVAAAELERHDASRASTLLFLATTCFGLVHGFGFAGFLMETGILGTSLFVPLLGFNLGVEVGQLLLVAVALGIATLFRDRVPRVVTPMLAASLCGVGVYWFIGRTLV
jgi:hypothetical protein